MAFWACTLDFDSSRTQLHATVPETNEVTSLNDHEKLQQHPYVVLNQRARSTADRVKADFLRTHGEGANDAWARPKSQIKAFKRFYSNNTKLLSASRWRRYRIAQLAERNTKPQVLYNDWGLENVSIYDGLTRAESSILLQCRTGYGGFRAWLHRSKVRYPHQTNCDMC